MKLERTTLEQSGRTAVGAIRLAEAPIFAGYEIAFSAEQLVYDRARFHEPAPAQRPDA
jgi:hypothetical protein